MQPSHEPHGHHLFENPIPFFIPLHVVLQLFSLFGTSHTFRCKPLKPEAYLWTGWFINLAKFGCKQEAAANRPRDRPRGEVFFAPPRARAVPDALAGYL